MFEQDLKAFRSRIENSQTIFFDRSFLDSAALIYDADLREYERIAHLLDTNRFNRTVFVTPPWEEIYIVDKERDQTFKEAVHTYNKPFDWYKSMGYLPKVLPKTSVNTRVDFILNELARW
jgi:predicted ATPase